MIKELREVYKELYGKKPFAAWGEDKLKEKIAEKQGGSVVAGTPVEPVEPVVVETPIVQEEAPVYKTDVEVIAEMNQPIVPPEIAEYNGINKEQICDHLFKVLRDGAYRSKLLQMKENPFSKDEFIGELYVLKDIIREGELKSHVEYYINLFSNL